MLHALPIIDKSQSAPDHEAQARMLLQEWVDMMDCPPRPYYRRRFWQWLHAGFEYELLQAAMVDTMCAPTPAWRYLEAILMRCGADQCFTGYAYANRRRPRSG